MANVTTYLQQGVQPAVGASRHYVMESEIDVTGAVSDDVYYALTVPAGHLVRNIVTEVVTKSGAADTCGVGIYSNKTGSAVDDDGFGGPTAISLNATVGTLTIGVGGTDTYVTIGGYLNLTPAITYIGLEMVAAGSTIAAGKLKVRALCVDCTSALP